MTVILRRAEPDDVPQILSMVNRFAEQNIMLPRSEEGVRQSIGDWIVAAHDGPPPAGEPQVVACGALVPLTDTLVEIRSLAVHESQQGKGLGSVLVERLVELAREQEYAQVCALTLREQFFVRLGFDLVDRWAISPKVWQACIYCRKFHRCDEVAVLMNLQPQTRPTTETTPEAAGGWSTLLKWSEWQPLKLAYRQAPARDLAADTRPSLADAMDSYPQDDDPANGFSHEKGTL
jgi:amino-acid N-acetyltransferase